MKPKKVADPLSPPNVALDILAIIQSFDLDMFGTGSGGRGNEVDNNEVYGSLWIERLKT